LERNALDVQYSAMQNADAQPMGMKHADAQPIRVHATDLQDILTAWRASCHFSSSQKKKKDFLIIVTYVFMSKYCLFSTVGDQGEHHWENLCYEGVEENNKILKELFEKECSRCSVFVHADAQPMRMEHADAQPITMLDTDVQDILRGMACSLRVSQVL